MTLTAASRTPRGSQLLERVHQRVDVALVVREAAGEHLASSWRVGPFLMRMCGVLDQSTRFATVQPQGMLDAPVHIHKTDYTRPLTT